MLSHRITGAAMMLLIAVGAMLAVLAFARPVHAQDMRFGAGCGDDPADGVSRRRAILACTAAIGNTEMSREDRAGMYAGRAYEYDQIGDLEHAVKDYTRAIEMKNGYVDAYIGRAAVYEELGDSARADSDYAQALVWAPHSPYLFGNRCWMRARMDRELDAGLADCNRSLELRHDDADTLDSRCFVHLRMGDNADAIADCDAALKSDPKMASSLYVRGLAKLRMGDAAGGESDIAAAEKIDAKVAQTYFGYGVKP